MGQLQNVADDVRMDASSAERTSHVSGDKFAASAGQFFEMTSTLSSFSDEKSVWNAQRNTVASAVEVSKRLDDAMLKIVRGVERLEVLRPQLNLHAMNADKILV